MGHVSRECFQKFYRLWLKCWQRFCFILWVFLVNKNERWWVFCWTNISKVSLDSLFMLYVKILLGRPHFFSKTCQERCTLGNFCSLYVKKIIIIYFSSNLIITVVWGSFVKSETDIVITFYDDPYKAPLFGALKGMRLAQLFIVLVVS